MVELGYNTGVNHIKSSQVLLALGYPFSTYVRGVDTMSHSIPNPSALKTCKTCGESKPLTEYSIYRSGSYKTSCKRCAAAYARQRRIDNPERSREIKNRAYAKNRERNSAEISARIASDPEYRRKRNERKQRWHEQNRDYVARQRVEYYAVNGDIARRYSREIRTKFPERYKARYRVAGAVARGVFPPASTMVCEHCQEAQAANWHHHRGYSEEYALDVIALCLQCHGKEHREL